VGIVENRVASGRKLRVAGFFIAEEEPLAAILESALRSTRAISFPPHSGQRTTQSGQRTSWM
jgi:hypothetical protein